MRPRRGGDPVGSRRLGYSAGSTAAYELAQQLNSGGRPVRVVLLDGSPGRHERTPAASPPARVTSNWKKVKERSLGQLAVDVPSAALRRIRHRVHRTRVEWRLRMPRRPFGKPQYDQLHYDRARRSISRAIGRYVVQPASFPIALVHITDSDAVARCTRVASSLTTHAVGGDHLSMMQPPHVGDIATVVHSLIKSEFGCDTVVPLPISGSRR